VGASRFIASTNLYQWNVNVNYPSNPASISEAAGLISNVVDKNILIFDLKLNLVEKLTYAASVNTIVGSAFNAGGHQLFLWNASASTVDAYDVLSWKLVGSVNLATTLDPADSSQKGTMLVDSSGRSLILDTQKGFEVVSLASELKLTVTGGGNADLLYGAAGPDTLSGAAGDDTLYGGAGNDSLDGGDGASLMWGEEGDDQISGGSGFDNINGNMGNDTAHGNAGDDWVVGGKDNDQVYGDAGNDIVYGNLGNDTVSGGDGNDWVRGGQGDDSVSGGAGNDVVWGDRGDDTVSGGAGADTFRFFSGGGVDRVTDFSYAEGDRVLIEGGATWTLAQSGSDTVVTLAGGADTLVLVGVNLSSLPAGWIAAG
jgi:Ca2+-binding RTX toxin-like protein